MCKGWVASCCRRLSSPNKTLRVLSESFFGGSVADSSECAARMLNPGSCLA